MRSGTIALLVGLALWGCDFQAEGTASLEQATSSPHPEYFPADDVDDGPLTVQVRDLDELARARDERHAAQAARRSGPAWLAKMQGIMSSSTLVAIVDYIGPSQTAAPPRVHLADVLVVEHIRGPAIPDRVVVAQPADPLGDPVSCGALRWRPGTRALLVAEPADDGSFAIVYDFPNDVLGWAIAEPSGQTYRTAVGGLLLYSDLPQLGAIP